MKKLRLALNKGEKLRFLSHLDYAQAVERMIRRAEIKMAYSEGFNPHMKISFSSALALGVTAAAEYIDMDVLEAVSYTHLDVYKRQNVQSIENDTEGFVKNAVITPSVDFYRLEEVFVLTSSSVSAPPKPGLEPKRCV